MRSRLRLNRTAARWTLLAFGLYLLFLALRLPAGMVLQRLPLPAVLHIGHASGSLWSGTLHDVRFRQLALGQLHWSFTPWTLFTGSLGAAVHLEGRSGRLRGWLGYGLGGALEVGDLRGRLNLSAFDSLTRPLVLDGTLHFTSLAARFEPGTRIRLDGQAEWRPALIGGVQDLSLGRVHLEAAERGDGSRIRIRNQDGDLALDGHLDLDPAGTWLLDLTLQNRDANRKDLQQILRFLGRPDSTGRYRFQRTGRLW